MNKFNDLKLYRGATSVIELDFTGFVFAENSKCQLTIEKKYNNHVIYQHDFDKPIKYYITFKDEFTANLDDDKYKYDIMYMLNDERYPQCEISDIYMEEVINNYNGEVNPKAVEVTEALNDGVEINDSIKINNSNVVIINSKLQELSITPSKEEQVITPNEDYDGFSRVKVDPIPNEYIIPTGVLDIKTNGTHEVSDKASVNVNVQPSLQDKTVIVKPSDNAYIMPDEDYYGLALVNVIGAVDTETVEATPTKEVQTINRSEDRYIESVKVNAIPDEYIVPSGELEITENGQYDVTDKASVNVETSGGDLSEYFKEQIDNEITYTYVPRFVDIIKKIPAFKNKEQSCSYMFHQCQSLESVDLSLFDTSKEKTFSYMFAYCKMLETLDLSTFDTSGITEKGALSYMFAYCENLKELNVNHFDVSNIGYLTNVFDGCKSLTNLDLSNWNCTITTTQNLFNNCENLVSVDISNINISETGTTSLISTFANCRNLENINWGNFLNNSHRITGLNRTFNSCEKLESLPLFNAEAMRSLTFPFSGCKALTTLGGFKDLGKGYTKTTANNADYALSFSESSNLTHDSLMNIINNLYDLNLTYDVANGGTLYTQKLVLGTTNKEKLTDEEIAIATAKGWTVS